ncbi:hypothetical protein M3Y99_01869900 [Aphelenchoides fujianensis]|nr:hypothetical protein M3Y99_01869900 [Aphelenchoides fujianensis]
MKTILLFVLLVAFISMPLEAALTKRAISGPKRTINDEALRSQQHFFFCLQLQGVQSLSPYLKVKYDPKKTKGEIVAHHERTLRRLGRARDPKLKSCIAEYKQKEDERVAAIDEARRTDRAKLNGAAQSAFDRINTVLDNQALTLDKERAAVGGIFGKLQEADRRKLLEGKTLSRLEALVSTAAPFDFAVHEPAGEHPLLSTTEKKLNAQLLHFCLRQAGDDALQRYWAIERKAGLKKADVWRQEQAFFQQLIQAGKGRECLENFLEREEERRELKNQEREELLSQMSGKTRDAFDKINKIRNDQKLTIDEEIQRIKKIEEQLDAASRVELFRLVPELRRYFNAGTYSRL